MEHLIIYPIGRINTKVILSPLSHLPDLLAFFCECNEARNRLITIEIGQDFHFIVDICRDAAVSRSQVNSNCNFLIHFVGFSGCSDQNKNLFYCYSLNMGRYRIKYFCNLSVLLNFLQLQKIFQFLQEVYRFSCLLYYLQILRNHRKNSKF